MHRPYFDMEASGARMREVRKSRGLSVKDVVDFMGLESTQAVYKWESGKCYPQADTLIALAMLYEVNPQELFVEEGQEPSFCFWGNSDEGEQAATVLSCVLLTLWRIFVEKMYLKFGYQTENYKTNWYVRSILVSSTWGMFLYG